MKNQSDLLSGLVWGEKTLSDLLLFIIIHPLVFEALQAAVEWGREWLLLGLVKAREAPLPSLPPSVPPFGPITCFHVHATLVSFSCLWLWARHSCRATLFPVRQADRQAAFTATLRSNQAFHRCRKLWVLWECAHKMFLHPYRASRNLTSTWKESSTLPLFYLFSRSLIG